MGEISLDQRTRVAVLAVLAVAVAVIAFLLISGGDEDTGAEGPAIVSADELSDLAASLGPPVYWVGERQGTKLEFELTSEGLVYVRYLTGDAEAGAPAADFLAVGTYPVGDAVAGLEEVASRPQTVRHDFPDGGLAVINTEKPNSAYVAYPGTNHQVEVYSPDPKLTAELAISGKVVPVP